MNNIEKEKEFNKLYEKLYEKAKLRAFKFFKGDFGLAEDSVSRAFMQVWAHMHKADPKYYSSWFFRIHTNEMLMMLKRAKKTAGTHFIMDLCTISSDKNESSILDTFKNCRIDPHLEERIQVMQFIAEFEPKYQRMILDRMAGKTVREAFKTNGDKGTKKYYWRVRRKSLKLRENYGF